MALMQWLTQLDCCDLAQQIAPRVAAAGFDIDTDVSNAVQLYAVETPQHQVRLSARVSLLMTWTNTTTHEAEVQVRSDEPMLQRNTRCEQAARRLQVVLPPCTSAA